MSNFVPIPKYIDFLKIFNFKKVDLNKVVLRWKEEGDKAGILSRSSWSLALISQWFKKYNQKNSSPNVWIPEYFCNYSLSILRKIGVKITFYPLKKDLSPDFDAIKKIAIENPPDIFLSVHYFGKIFDCSKIQDFCRAHKSWLIEDATHVIEPNSPVGQYGDFILFSPHKFYPILNGAILVIKKNKTSNLQNQDISHFGDLEKWYEDLKNLQKKFKFKVSNNNLNSILWLSKRLVQKFGINYKKINNFSVDGFDENLDTAKIAGPEIDFISKKFFNNYIHGLKKYKDQRDRNYLLLERHFKQINTNFSFESYDDFKNKHHPYLFKINGTQNHILNKYNSLKDKKVAVCTWPDLPPEIRDRHNSTAIQTRNNNFFIPIHDINKIFFELIKEEINKLEISVVWNGINREEWEKIFMEIDKSNLLQSWNYGESKSKTEKYKAHRLVFKKDGKVISIAQILEKNYLKLFKIFRLNRGPLFAKNVDNNDKKLIYKILISLGDIAKFRILSIAPELKFSSENILYKTKNRTKLFKFPSWQSSWINLADSEEDIRKKMMGRWRSALNFALSRKNLDIDLENTEQNFNWLLNNYRELKLYKNFKGLNEKLIVELYNSSDLITLIARKDKRPVGGICIAIHGNSSTYLLGYSSEEAKKEKANNFLLWNAVIELKKRKYKWLDLGGIDFEDNIGVAKFKLGMGGEDYKLIGEGLSF